MSSRCRTFEIRSPRHRLIDLRRAGLRDLRHLPPLRPEFPSGSASRRAFGGVQQRPRVTARSVPWLQPLRSSSERLPPEGAGAGVDQPQGAWGHRGVHFAPRTGALSGESTPARQAFCRRALFGYVSRLTFVRRNHSSALQHARVRLSQPNATSCHRVGTEHAQHEHQQEGRVCCTFG